MAGLVLAGGCPGDAPAVDPADASDGAVADVTPDAADPDASVDAAAGPYLLEPFPPGFLWGAATAGFQSDMGCPSAPCVDDKSDWYQWVTAPEILTEGLVVGDPVQDGPGQWELMEADLDRAAAEMGHNGYRFSFEWSRLFPTSTEGASTEAEVDALADPAAVARYHEMLAHLAATNITPLVTLNHYTLPLWIHDGVACHESPETCVDRGWLGPDRLIPEMVKYASFAAREFGAEVDLWATLNEPFAVILAGFAVPSPAERTNPPGINDLTFGYATDVIQNMIIAHARIYDAVHAADAGDADGDGVAAMVGLVPNLAAVISDEPETEVGKQAEANAFHLYNRYFLDALIKGSWDPDFDGVADEVRDDLVGRMDFVGINYYLQLAITALETSLVEAIPLFTFLPDPFNLGDGYPPGLYEVSMFVAEEYGLPIYITENRLDVPHLVWLRKAINEGADVRGYFHWSLIDNYEWNHGFGFELGLYSYDAETKARTAKPDVDLYRQVTEAGGLTLELIEQHVGEWLPEDADLAP